MIKDNEILIIEESNNEYEINWNTIRYDGKAKRFFKGFTPKLTTSSAVMILSAVGCAATIMTGGLAAVSGVVSASIAGAIGAGACTYTIFNGVDASKVSQSRFKSIGIGGKEGLPGTIEIIEESERNAYRFSQLLANNPDVKKFKLEDGATYSRRDLKKRIKGYEHQAYNGLKYILKQGLHTSAQIEKLRTKSRLTEREEKVLEKYWDIMDRIGKCVKNVTSQRDSYNPYKGLIMDAMQGGCLLGNWEQNNRIRSIATIREKETTQELYFEMYERELLERNQVKEPAPKPIDRQEYEELKTRNAELSDQLSHEQHMHKVATKNALNKRAQNKTLKAENAELNEKLQSLTKKHNKLVEKFNNLNTTYQSIRREYAKLNKMFASARAGELDAVEKIDELVENIKSYIEYTTNLEKQLKAQKAEFDKLKELNADLEEQNDALEAEAEMLENAKENVQTLKQIVLDLNAKLKTEKSKRAKAEKDAKTSSDLAKNLQADVANYESLLQTIQEDSEGVEQFVQNKSRNDYMFNLNGAKRNLTAITRTAEALISVCGDKKKFSQKLQDAINQAEQNDPEMTKVSNVKDLHKQIKGLIEQTYSKEEISKAKQFKAENGLTL